MEEDKAPASFEENAEWTYGEDLDGGERRLAAKSAKNVETSGLPDADSGDGCSEKIVEVIEVVQDADAEQEKVESTQDVCIQELCVTSDVSTKLEDIESSDDSDENRGYEEEKNGAVRHLLSWKRAAQINRLGVMQEQMVPLEGFEGDADVRTEEKTESAAWKGYVLAVMGLMRTASLEECLLAEGMMKPVAKRILWMICKIPRRGFWK